MSKELSSPKEYRTGSGASIYILIICTLLWMVNWMDRQVLSAVLEPMKADLRLNDGDMGIIGTVFLVSIAILSFPAAYLIDRWSRRKTLGIMALLWSLFTFLTGKAWNFWTVLIPRSLVGVGEAGYSAGGSAMIAAAYSSKARGVVLGIFNMGIPLGVALGSLLGGMLAKQYGWQAPFLFFAIPGIILAIMAFFMKDYKTVHQTNEQGGKVTFGKSIATIFKIPTLVWVAVGYGITNIMTMSFMFWAPAFIGRAWSVDVAVANSALVPIVLLAIVGSPLGGILADVWFRKNPRGRFYIPAIATIGGALAIIGAIYFQFKGAAGTSLWILFGLLNAMALPAVSAATQDVAPVAQKGLAWGIMVACGYFLGGAWSPYLVGAISNSLGQDAQALGTALSIAAALGGILGGLCFLMASRPYPMDMEKVKLEQVLAEK